MKILLSSLLLLLLFSFVSGKERAFTGSTPAGNDVRSFLGIPPSDSVDFIRWKLTIADNRYEVQCNYGISKANTNGFVNGGARVVFSGDCRKEKNIYHFQNNRKTFEAIELNADLLHFLGADNRLLVGNAGWSYTLNSIAPSGSNNIIHQATSAVLKDSMSFEGRTPCHVPGVVAPGSLCYKLKWSITLYANAAADKPGNYTIKGTPWRRLAGKRGSWKMTKTKNGQTTYALNNEKGKGFLYLLKLDEHVLVFTDAKGKPLVGNEDFSYTLNRRW